MTYPTADLAALIGSRICHDLICPIGAIHNGLELMELTGGDGGSELGLITESANHASARIGFFRLAFGAANTQELSARETSALIKGYYGQGRLKVSWSSQSPCPRAQVRDMFLAILCCETALPRGGEIVATAQVNGWSVTATADRIELDPALWDGLSGGQIQACAPAQVQFPLLAHWLEAATMRVIVHHEGGTLRLGTS